MPMIIGEIRRYLRDNNSLRVSRSLRDLAYKSLKIKEEISREKGREATISEIAEALKIRGENKTEEEISASIDAIAQPVSLYDPVYSEGEDSLFVMDRLCDKNEGEDIWLEGICLKEAIKGLSQREKSILQMRFFKGKTQMEIASEIGISQAQVSRVEKGAIDRIRRQM